MDIKEFLNHIKNYSVEIEALQAESEYMRRIDTAEARLRARENDKKIAKMIGEQIAVSLAVEKLSDPLARAVMKRRYVLGETWRKIARESKLGERNLHYIKQSCLEELETLLKKELEKEG